MPFALQATLLIALLQPPPETFDLFDDVLILAEGHIAYHGPRDGVLSFFQGLGFDCPADVALADFLQEVVLPSDQGKYWAGDAATFRPIPPAEVSKRFYASSTGAAALGPLASSFPADKVHNDALAKEKFGRPALYLLRCVLRRGAKLQRASLPISIARLVQTAFTAFMVATLFMNTAKQDVSDGLFFLAVAFFSVTFM